MIRHGVAFSLERCLATKAAWQITAWNSRNPTVTHSGIRLGLAALSPEWRRHRIPS